jgi:hypothetical protein
LSSGNVCFLKSACREKMVKPAVRHVALFFAERYQLDILVDRFEDFYFILLAGLQWKSLRQTSSSVIESLYGLQRVSVSNKTDPAGSLELSSKQRVLSILFMVVLPRIMVYFKDLSERIRSRATATNVEATQETIRSENLANNIIIPPTMVSWALSSVESPLRAATTSVSLYLAHVFPYVQFSWEALIVFYHVLYLCQQSQYHHPVFALLGLQLQKRSKTHRSRTSIFTSTSSSNSVNSNGVSSSDAGVGVGVGGGGGSGSGYSNWPTVVVLALVLGVRVSEYLVQQGPALQAGSLSARLTQEVPLPRPPQPSKPPAPTAQLSRERVRVGGDGGVNMVAIGAATDAAAVAADVAADVAGGSTGSAQVPGTVLMLADKSLCALCRRKRVDPCATTGGYVFCYLCILAHVRRYARCPITALPCSELDIVKLYQDQD